MLTINTLGLSSGRLLSNNCFIHIPHLSMKRKDRLVLFMYFRIFLKIYTE